MKQDKRPSLSKIKELFSKEASSKDRTKKDLSLKSVLRHMNIPHILSHYERLKTCNNKLSQECQNQLQAKQKSKFKEGQSVVCESAPKDDIRTSYLYVINMLSLRGDVKKHLSENQKKEHEFFRCDVQKQLSAVEQFRKLANVKKPEQRSSLSVHKIETVLEKEEEKNEETPDSWEGLFKVREERQFVIGRITKYFTS